MIEIYPEHTHSNEWLGRRRLKNEACITWIEIERWNLH